MKFVPMIVALAVVASVTACEYKEERVVQQPAPAPAAVVAAPVPAGSVVYTPPASSGDDDRLYHALTIRSWAKRGTDPSLRFERLVSST
jgi:hypothetical protein